MVDDVIFLPIVLYCEVGFGVSQKREGKGMGGGENLTILI